VKIRFRSALHAVATAVLLAVTPLSYAMTPEDGAWWNPSQSGRGWFIMSQNNLMVVASYGYAQNGAPQWYLSTGTFNPRTRAFSASLLGFQNGQCIGCSYRDPTQTPSPGNLTITFTADDRATLTQAGETVQIEKFMFGYPQTNDRLWGEWAFSAMYSSIGDGEHLTFDGTYVSNTGTQYVQARRTYSTLGLALGRYDAGIGKYAVLLDSSTSYYKLFVFQPGANRALNGNYWLYLKTASPTGDGYKLAAVRVRDRTDLTSTQVVQEDEEKSNSAGLRELFDMELSNATPAKGDVPMGVQSLAEELVTELENAKRAQLN